MKSQLRVEDLKLTPSERHKLQLCSKGAWPASKPVQALVWLKRCNLVVRGSRGFRGMLTARGRAWLKYHNGGDHK